MSSTCRARRRWLRILQWVTSIVAFVLVMLAARTAAAQKSTFYLDRLQIGGEPNDGIAVWRPRMNERTVFFGQFALGYSLHPLRGDTAAPLGARSPSDLPNPVAHQLTTYLTAGIEILERVSLSVTEPVVLYQAASGGAPLCAAAGVSNCQSTSPHAATASDVRVDARVIMYRNDPRTFHFAMYGSLYPAAGTLTSFGTDGSTHGALGLMTEVDTKSVILALNTGVQFRPNNQLNQILIGNEWTWAFGGFLPLRDGKARIGAELFGSTGLREDTRFTKRNTPLEWMGEFRMALDKDKAGWLGFGAGTRLSGGYGAPDLRMLGLIGYSFGLKDTDPNAPGRRYEFRRDLEPKSVDTDKDGIPDDLDLCPTIPEDHQPPDPSDGCPAPADRDHDGIPDDVDKCPDVPEDKDGIDDLDGCPEDDFDQDGIPDTSDACPREPGQPNQDPKKNGCPQFIRHVEGSTEIQILKRVEFATASAQLLPTSYPILDEVVKLLKTNKDIQRVAVEGHTDSRGAHDMNMKLSQARAESVATYLGSHGVSVTRLEAHGYGPDKPIDSNDTDPGRQRNRRVEFHIKSSE